MQHSNVLPSKHPVRTNAYREAVASIVRRVQHLNDETDTETAENIGCSVGTLVNARNKKTDLSGIFLTRLEAHYGAGTIDPWLALSGTRSVPLESCSERDILPFLTRATLKIVEARDPKSEGGPNETRKERAEYLEDLRASYHEHGCLIAAIERELAA